MTEYVIGIDIGRGERTGVSIHVCEGDNFTRVVGFGTLERGGGKLHIRLATPLTINEGDTIEVRYA